MFLNYIFRLCVVLPAALLFTEPNWCCTCSATLEIVVQKKCKYYSPYIKQFKDNNFSAETNKLGAMEFISIEVWQAGMA